MIGTSGRMKYILEWLRDLVCLVAVLVLIGLFLIRFGETQAFKIAACVIVSAGVLYVALVGTRPRRNRYK